jgi:hypothetical protein
MEMNAPSRDFMVRQAVLNAAITYDPPVAKILGVRTFIDCMTAGDYVRLSFCDQVRKEYSLLASRHGVAA